jgi:RHS repeat-associated protein
VTSITYKQNGTTVLGDLTYEYDKAGNRTKIGGTWARTGLPQTISTSNYNANNQQLTLGDKTLTYDDNGNLTSIVDGTGTTLYTWNARNQLTGISGPGVTGSFVYDGTGRREKKTINSNLTEFLFDGVNPIQETSGTTILANILTGLGVDEFLTRTEVPAATTSYFLPDTLGSALALADSAGVVQTEYTYEPFGQTTSTGNSNSNPLEYTGRENDDTGLYYYRARYYHPGLQRFVSEDPLFHPTFGTCSTSTSVTQQKLRTAMLSDPQLPNSYAYVDNNPIRFGDPLGLEKKPPPCKPVPLWDCYDVCTSWMNPPELTGACSAAFLLCSGTGGTSLPACALALACGVYGASSRVTCVYICTIVKVVCQ